VIGLLQGVTELFPISSHGHSVLLPAWIGGSWEHLVTEGTQKDSTYPAFIVALHVATAVALLVFYARDWVVNIGGLVTVLRTRPVQTSTQRLAMLIIIATIPVGILGLAYAAEHGSAAPPLSVVVDTFPLGRWVAARRRDYHADTLKLERIRALEALPGWSWQHHHDRWRQRLAELRDLVGVHGTVRAACTTQAGNPRLVRWVQTQRVAYRAGTLAPDRIHALEALPGWKWAPRQPHTRPG